jgi:hypothetical protein
VTLQDFSRDMVPIIAIGIGGLGLVSLVLLWRQMRSTNQWNKLQTQNGFINQDLDDLSRKLQESLKLHGIIYQKQRDALPDNLCQAIRDDDRAFFDVKTYLNTFENIAAAVRIGFVDSDFAYAIECGRLCAANRIFLPLIKQLRDYHDAPEICIELENVRAVWEARKLQEAKALAQAEKSMMKKFRESMGLSKPKV